MSQVARPLASFPLDGEDWGGVLRYGPLVADERQLRLLGNPAGRRVLLLGCGAGQPAVALAAAGARVIAVEPSAASVAAAREHGAAQGVPVEVHQGNLAELAFVRAETIDAVVSIFALAGVANLNRVFRQVHRVLRGDGPIVLSLPHPVLATVEDTGRNGSSFRFSRSYVDLQPVRWSTPEAEGTDHVHTVEQVVTALTRAGFRVDTLAEPMAEGRTQPPILRDVRAAETYWQAAMRHLPAVLIVRARKMGL